MTRIHTALVTSAIAASLFATSALAQVPKGNPEAAKVKNPVAATPESVAAGKQTYERRCLTCHAPTGGGTPAAGYHPASPSLIDDQWEHGSTDGEIAAVVTEGVPPDNFMEPFGDRLSDADIWNVVNYIRSLKK